MPQLHRACSLIALLALFSPAALHAQDNPRWYKVELLVFANLAAPGSEQWPATPVLDYPAVNRFLVYPERVREARENHGGPSELDQRGLLTLRPPPQPESETEQDTPDIPYLTDPNSVPPPAAEVEAPAPDIEEELPRPMPFVVLPAQQREFLGKAAYMERSGEFYTLFHQAWVQPVQAEADALPIVLDFSGDQDNWPQLQGSVTIFVERYLHLDTNLWFNTKGYYLPGDWQMPAPPLGPASIEVIEPEPQALDTQDGLETNSGFDTLGWRETPLAEDPNTPDPALDAPTYPWRHAVLMQQSRRMRSHEVHYIDHPLFGAVIKLTPLDEETLETMAAERAEIDAELRGDQPAGEDSAAM